MQILCKFGVLSGLHKTVYVPLCLRVWEEVIKNWKNEFFCHIYRTPPPPSLFYFFPHKQLVNVTEVIDSPLVLSHSVMVAEF